MKLSALFVLLSVASFACAQAPVTNAANPPPAAPSVSPAAPYGAEDGPHAVDVKITAIRDESRHRDIPLKIYFPKEDAKGGNRYPVVIFSHGAGASKDSYVYIGQFLATHGFVVIHPSHAGSDSGILRVGMPLRNVFKIKAATKDPKNRKDRPLDVKFVIDHLAEIAKKVPGLAEKLDSKNVAVGGHSFGAYTALAVAGAGVKIDGAMKDFSDPRVKAFFAMSPQGEGIMFTADSWSKIKAPMLLITGSKDRGIDGQNAEWRTQAYRAMEPGDKYLVYIDEATHLSFADFVAGVKEIPVVHPTVKTVLWAFLDFYLDGNSLGHDYLLSDTLKTSTNGAVRIEHK